MSFKPEDKPRLTDELMAKIALEYMQMMGITDTQFLIVRHHNTDNPHCHIVMPYDEKLAFAKGPAAPIGDCKLASARQAR